MSARRVAAHQRSPQGAADQRGGAEIRRLSLNRTRAPAIRPTVRPSTSQAPGDAGGTRPNHGAHGGSPDTLLPTPPSVRGRRCAARVHQGEEASPRRPEETDNAPGLSSVPDRRRHVRPRPVDSRRSGPGASGQTMAITGSSGQSNGKPARLARACVRHHLEVRLRRLRELEVIRRHEDVGRRSGGVTTGVNGWRGLCLQPLQCLPLVPAAASNGPRADQRRETRGRVAAANRAPRSPDFAPRGTRRSGIRPRERDS